MEKTNTKVAVIGLGKSGFESALFLKREGYRIFATDQQNTPGLNQQAQRLTEENIEVQLGSHSEQEILSCDWVLISPGIKPETEVFQRLKKSGKPIYSEIEVASWFCESKNIIAVTGSCGKTTLVTLVADMLRKAGKETVMCGNIGNPWIGELDDIHEDTYVVLELSSFQLYGCREFKPHIAILTNLYPNHLDWHEDMDDYAQAKMKIFAQQTKSDYAIFRQEEQTSLKALQKIDARPLVIDEGETNPHLRILEVTADILAIPKAVAREVYEGFEGLEHRMEPAGEFNQVTFINDSKSTTTASLKWALQKLKPKKVHLIAGGIAKSKDFGDIEDLIEAVTCGLYLFGRDKDLLADAWKAGNPVCFEELEQAVEAAFSRAKAGEVIILSPACASFDQFKNYIDRGNAFKACVHDLKIRNKQLR